METRPQNLKDCFTVGEEPSNILQYITTKHCKAYDGRFQNICLENFAEINLISFY